MDCFARYGRKDGLVTRFKHAIVILAVISALTALVPSPALAIPQIPMQFYGNVTIQGSQATDGIQVEARIAATTYASTTTKDGKYGYDPVFVMAADDPDTPAKEGAVDGDIIAFYVGGSAVATVEFSSGTNNTLNLEVASVPAPVVVVASPNGGESWAGGSQCDITWVTIDTDKDFADIEYTTNGGSNWSTIVAGIEDTGTYQWTVPALDTATAKVRVTATDQTGNTGTDVSDGNFAIDSTAPSITDVLESGISSTGATISWSTDEAATSQVEYGATDAYGLTTAKDLALAAAHTISVSGLEPDTTYHYRVISQDAAGNQAASADNSFSTTTGTGTATISEVTASDVTTSTAVITWTTDVAADSQVEYGTTNAYGLTTTLNTAETTEHRVSLSGLVPNTTYHYRSISAGTVSADYTFTTLAETTPPVISAVDSPVVTVSTAVITWQSNELSTSQVVYDTVSHSSGSADDYQSSTPLGTALVLSHGIGLVGLAPATQYYYRVVSVDACDNETLSAEYSFSTMPDSTAPIILDVTASAATTNGAVVSWSTNEAATGQVFYDTASSAAPTDYQWSTALNDSLLLSRSCGLAALTPDTQYYYRVVSSDASGNEAVSAEYTFTTLEDTTPPVVTGVTAVNATATGAVIVWVTNENTITRLVYDTVSRSSIDDYAFAAPVPEDATADSTSHAVVLTGLSPDVTYYYRIVSTDAYGNQEITRQYNFKTEDKTAPYVDSISEMAVTSTSAVIVWVTDEHATTRVEYGTASATHGSYEFTTDLDPALLSSHAMLLNGLTPGTTYYYRVISQDADGNETVSQEFSFATS